HVVSVLQSLVRSQRRFGSTAASVRGVPDPPRASTPRRRTHAPTAVQRTPPTQAAGPFIAAPSLVRQRVVPALERLGTIASGPETLAREAVAIIDQAGQGCIHLHRASEVRGDLHILRQQAQRESARELAVDHLL